jgi:hypothetical protein
MVSRTAAFGCIMKKDIFEGICLGGKCSTHGKWEANRKIQWA